MYIVLYGKNNTEIDKAIIDFSDYELIKDFKWGKSAHGYASTMLKRKSVTLHSFLLKEKINNTHIDHINRNKLDNRRNNLRFASYSENIINTGIKINNTSGITGVNWDKFSNKWMVLISINKKSIKVGRFNDIKNATYVRFKCEILYYGEFIPDKDMKIKFIQEYEKENKI